MDGLQIQWLYEPDSVDMAEVTCRVINALVRPGRTVGLPDTGDRRPLRPEPTPPAPEGPEPMDPLTGSVQHYAWGSRTALPAFLGVEPDGRAAGRALAGRAPSRPRPCWAAPSLADRHRGRPGGVVVEAEPVAEFGPRLPYLLKVLAAGEPLSLQAHPTREEAETGFAREEAAGPRAVRPDPALPRRLAEAGDAGGARRRRSPVRLPRARPDVRPRRSASECPRPPS